MTAGNTLPALPHNQHLEQVKILWDLEGPCEFFRYVTNSIYLGTRSQQKCVIRLTHPRSRNLEQLNSEFSFMEEVSVAGIRTVLPFRNQKGNWVERVSCEKGNLFYVSVFPFASGAPPTREEMETKQILMEWGQTIAKLHQVGQKYQAPQGTLERPEWNQETVLLTAQASTQADTSDRDSLAQCVTSLHRKFEKGVSRLEYGTKELESWGLEYDVWSRAREPKGEAF
jgi:Ser/Thr protein kinase RdoA (MazF antagonist)